MPVGLWRITEFTNQARPGDTILFCPVDEPVMRRYPKAGPSPSGLEPIIKSVIGPPGDLISVTDEGISAGGELIPNSKAKTIDGAGRPLTPFPSGEYRVGIDEVWVGTSEEWS